MRKFGLALIAAAAFLVSPAYAAMMGNNDVTKIQNPETARPDYITKISTRNIVAGSNITVVANSTGVTISATGGGGGASSLAVDDEGVQISSPTQTINFVGAGVTVTLQGTSSATVTIPGSGGGGASSLAVGTGTLSNFTNNITSPTAAISFFGVQFRSLAAGTTNIIYIDTTTATGLLPKDLAATTYQPLDATLTDLAAAPLSEDNSIAVGAIAAGTLPTDVMASSAAVSLFYSDNSVRSNLGLAIGTDVQAFDATLSDLAAAPLGEDNSVSVGAIAAGTLPTDVMASSAAVSLFYSDNSVRSNLGLAIGTNVEAYDADLDDLADGTLTGSKVGTGINDDNVDFDDADSNFAATTIGAAIEELDDANGSGPNAADYKVNWTQIGNMPAGFSDGTDDTGGGGGSSSLAVGTGTLTNFTTNVTSPTAAISFLGSQFRSLALGTTNVVYIDTTTATGLLPKDLAATTYQPLDATLTDLASAPLTEDNSIDPTSVAAGILPSDVQASSASVSLFYSDNSVRTNLGLAIGTNVQAYDADLDDLADGTLTGSKVGTGINDDNVDFDDADSNFAATTIGAAVEELDDVNGSGPNAADGKVAWTQLVNVPAGFADGSDDGAGGGGSDNLGSHVATMTITAGFGITASTLTVTSTFTVGALFGVYTSSVVINGISSMTLGAGAVLDVSAAILDLPTSTTPPTADCNEASENGRVYIDSDAPASEQVYVCQGTSGWKLQGMSLGRVVATAQGFNLP